MTARRRWLLTLLLTAVAVAVCYWWVDRPLARLHDPDSSSHYNGATPPLISYPMSTRHPDLRAQRGLHGKRHHAMWPAYR